MTSLEEMPSLASHTEITRNLAVLTGIDSQTNTVKRLNQELIKVGGGHPIVEFVKEDNSTQAMKSDQWVTNNQMKMAGCKHILDRAKNKADSAEKTMETEIMKSLGKLEFDKFNPSKNCLVWPRRQQRINLSVLSVENSRIHNV